jgi:hypothetical protein
VERRGPFETLLVALRFLLGLAWLVGALGMLRHFFQQRRRAE